MTGKATIGYGWHGDSDMHFSASAMQAIIAILDDTSGYRAARDYISLLCLRTDGGGHIAFRKRERDESLTCLIERPVLLYSGISAEDFRKIEEACVTFDGTCFRFQEQA